MVTRATPRSYLGTSVYGGAFDAEYARQSLAFLAQVRSGEFRIVTSAIVQREIRNAPAQVRQLYAEFAAQAELVPTTEEVEELAVAYLDAGIVPESSEVDALHIALATVAGCDLLISWNFKHMVNFYRVPRYNAVNTLRGYPAITIQSPPQVLRDEDERV